MSELNQINSEPKSGLEYLTNNGDKTSHTLLDFWKWSVSDILSNATRGKFAEFIVGTAVGLDSSKVRQEWDAFDLTTETGIKIEIKSSAYIQSWKQKSYSKISFSIKPARYWDAKINLLHQETKRHADVYVFCHLKHKNQDTIDPLKMEQWDFYILPTVALDKYKRSQHSITLNSLQKLTEAKPYSELKMAIEQTYLQQKKEPLSSF